MWVDNRPKEDVKMPMIKIGFRQYADDGDKVDSEGKPYYGYSESQD